MNLLVTGGLGFIGHNVVKQLQDQGHQVCVIDSQTNYGIIPQNELNSLLTERYSSISEDTYVYNDDITDNHAVNRIFEIQQPEVVIHLASFPRQKVVNANPQWGSRVMSEGLLNLLEASDKYEVRKFVYISSSMVYGDFNDDVKENHECRPQGQYGILKLAGEWLVKDYYYRTNLDYTIIRPSAVYGPRDVEDRVVSKFLINAINGKQLNVNGPSEALDFTYVDDIATGIVQASLSDNTDGKTYNITRGRSRTLLDAAQLAVDISGSGSINLNNRDMNFPSRGSLNIDRARTDFNYNPVVDIEEGFKRYHEWLTNSPLWSKKTV
jgi:nucleoside-diphosphate-sugar epimerase